MAGWQHFPVSDGSDDVQSRRAKQRDVLQKPHGIIHPRAQKVGPKQIIQTQRTHGQ